MIFPPRQHDTRENEFLSKLVQPPSRTVEPATRSITCERDVLISSPHRRTSSKKVSTKLYEITILCALTLTAIMTTPSMIARL
jgi:hypothetical protein